MANFTSFDAYAKALDQMQKDVDKETRTIIAREMGERAQRIATTAASADLGGDPEFSGWKPQLDTRIKQTPVGVVLMPTRSSAGPWTVAEFGRHRGNASGFAGPGINRSTGKTSRTKSGGLRKVRATKGRRWNGTTNPKGTASTATERMDHELPSIAERGVRKVMTRHFDVT